MTALETARSEAQRQQLYLERIVQPNRPDVAIEPRRIRSVIIILVLGLMSWGILSLLAASVREHLN
jgi:capsular polysaccharide transport system permease protein